MSYIEDINRLQSVTFDDMVNAAAQNLSSDKRVSPWLGLSHGVKLLETEDDLNKYLCAYGEMHKEKINLALESITDPSEFVNKEITIIDWGCGQGLATVCFFDYMHGLGLRPNVKKIILIEPSRAAIKRAVFHVSKFTDASTLVAKNEFANDISNEDVAVSDGLVINFFSNILDIDSVDLNHLSTTIMDAIPAEQLHFCVGPQNIGASRISQFAGLFNITEEELINAYAGRLSGRGTVSLLVFRVKTRVAEIVKVEYQHRRSATIENSITLQRILRDIAPSSSQSINALQFYKLAIELERFKSAKVTDDYNLPMHFDEVNSPGKLNIDIQENSEFEKVFLKNANPAYTKWPKHLNVGIGVRVGDKIYRLLQFIYPFEDIKNIDISSQYVSVSLNDFLVDPNVADALEMSEDMQKSIELMIKDQAASKDSLQTIIKEAISNDAEIDDLLHVALTSEAPALSQVNSELRNLIAGSSSLSPLLVSFLKGYLSDNHIEDINPDTLIQVVSMDESQRKAIQSALESRVSVITGPPGTGKTQMILNLIANLMMKDKSVLIASKVNKAVDNIKERYDSIDENHYLIRFGSKETVRDQVLPYLEVMLGKIQALEFNDRELNKLLSKYQTACELVSQGRKLLLELATLREEYPSFEIEKERLSKQMLDLSHSFDNNQRDLDGKYNDVINLAHSSTDWQSQQVFTRQQINTIQRKNSGIGKLFFSKKKYGEILLNHLLSLPNTFASTIERETGIHSVNDIKKGDDLLRICDKSLSIIERILSYDAARNQLVNTYEQSKKQLESSKERATEQQTLCYSRMTALSNNQAEIEKKLDFGRNAISSLGQDILKNMVLQRMSAPGASRAITRFRSYLPDRIPWRSDEMAGYRRDTAEFLKIFRLNAVTNLSVKNAYPLDKELVDVVIIDEASQCDIASALPLIQRARQIVIIGDPLQLHHISSINLDEEQALKEKLNLTENTILGYSNMSLYDYCQSLIVTAQTNNRRVVLEGHYRCHPEIIGYSNDFFYERRLGTRLQVYTKEVNPQLAKKGIIWEDVKGEQKSDTINVNEAEVTRSIKIAEGLLKTDPNINIGIISPFKHQAQELNAKIGPLVQQFGDRIVADTVYKFQGAERDVIIYSLVVTNNSPESKIRWIDYNCPNLVNVAVTRARTALYIVGNREYIRNSSSINRPLGYLVDYTERKAAINTDNDTITYVIDTNVFINCPDILDRIPPKDRIVVPTKVVDELDKLKVTLSPADKPKAEHALRILNTSFDTNRIRMENADTQYLPVDLRRNNPDNLILSVAMKFKNHNVTLLTSDNGLQLKARGLGLRAQSLRDYLN